MPGARASNWCMSGRRRTAVEDCLLLTVSDDGCGIEPGTPKGRGMQGMQERVQALDGAYGLADAPSGGTILRIAIPLHDVMELVPRASAS